MVVNCLASRRHFQKTYKTTMIRYFHEAHKNNHDERFYKTLEANHETQR